MATSSKRTADRPTASAAQELAAAVLAPPPLSYSAAGMVA
jgi:hypothetical protein